MGGHGRALEALEEVLGTHEDPASILDEVCKSIRSKYPAVFDSPLFTNAMTCQKVLVTILSRERYCQLDEIGSMTVDDLQSLGLIRWTPDYRLECAFMLLLLLIKKHVTNIGGNAAFDVHLTRLMLEHQSFEDIVAFLRCLKSVVYCDTPVELSAFHPGAMFGPMSENIIDEAKSFWCGPMDQLIIHEPKPRALVEATKHLLPESSGSDPLTCFTNAEGDINMAETDKVVVDKSSHSTGAIFSSVQLVVNDEKILRTEVIQCKVLEAKRMSKSMYDQERAKSVNASSDVFLLFTPARVATKTFFLPAGCGIVTKNEFGQYFGPFESRVQRSLEASSSTIEKHDDDLLKA
ncbi:hypothetical protein PHYBOEH_004277 [Phytophthora boehmeriae]|uniref:Uncharacterized protein n=1 Tax=Phytophthora boehmeriae TaxID=109152 RepID=A0A8T1WPC2_9STRA|nr:hypothetical protein PHYBOEH_004277 [Phytophthora boehmeriae]